MIAQQSAYDPGTTPRWGYQTSFWQRRRPAFWLFVITLLITGLDFLAQQLQLIALVPGAWFTTVFLLVPYAIPVVAIIYFLDLYEHEPISILAAAVLWGGIAATTLAIYTNTPLMELIFKITGDPNFTQSWSAALTAPFVEEGFKALGVILLIAIARAELDDVLDGFVWGAMVGIGFLLVEDVLYFVRAFAQTGGYDTLFGMFMIRILGAGPYSHFLYTGLVGMGIAYYTTRTDQVWGRRVGIGLLLAAAGVAAHFFWNSPIFSGLLDEGGFVGWAVYVTIKGLPMLIGLILIVRLARQRERRWFRDLQPDVLRRRGDHRGRARRARRSASPAPSAAGRRPGEGSGRQEAQGPDPAPADQPGDGDEPLRLRAAPGGGAAAAVRAGHEGPTGGDGNGACDGRRPGVGPARAGRPGHRASRVLTAQAQPTGWGQPAQPASSAPAQAAPPPRQPRLRSRGFRQRSPSPSRPRRSNPPWFRRPPPHRPPCGPPRTSPLTRACPPGRPPIRHRPRSSRWPAGLSWSLPSGPGTGRGSPPSMAGPAGWTPAGSCRGPDRRHHEAAQPRMNERGGHPARLSRRSGCPFSWSLAPHRRAPRP